MIRKILSFLSPRRLNFSKPHWGVTKKSSLPSTSTSSWCLTTTPIRKGEGGEAINRPSFFGSWEEEAAGSSPVIYGITSRDGHHTHTQECALLALSLHIFPPPFSAPSAPPIRRRLLPRKWEGLRPTSSSSAAASGEGATVHFPHIGWRRSFPTARGPPSGAACRRREARAAAHRKSSL